MADNVPKLEEISSSLEKLSDVTEKVAKGRTSSRQIQILIALLSLLITVVSVWNNWRIGQLSEQQDELKGLVTTQQNEIVIGTSMLHESLLILDTGDERVRKSKITAQVSLILALMERYAENPTSEETTFMKPFYDELLETLPSSLSTDDAQQLRNYIAEEIAPPTADQVEPVSSSGIASAPTVAASIHNGEAVRRGTASGWNFDVFWCVGKTPYPGVNDSEKLAEIVYEGLVARQPKENLGRIRLRRLPEIMNQTSRYEIGDIGVMIHRYPSKPKIEEADKLKSWIEQDLKGSRRSEIVTIENGTHNLRLSLSAFACLP